MNTHDIKLPPLPYPQIPGNDYTARDMHTYAIAAIEADRQARGEPTDSAGYTLGPVSDGGFDPRDRGEPVAWENFPGYLIDHCEGDVISEEGLQHALSAMLKDPQYSAPQPPQIPEGYKLVPIEPTREMMRAGWLIPLTGGDEIMADCDPDIEKIYRAMLEAAPEVKP